MKNSRRNVANADYEAHKRLEGPPRVSKYAAKRRQWLDDEPDKAPRSYGASVNGGE